jgi:hypothetical protein
MAEENDRSGGTAVRPPRPDAPPAPRTAPAPSRGRLVWLMVALVAAGMLLLATWAVFQAAELGGSEDLAPASVSPQELMDQVAPEPFVPAPSEGASSGYTGDWKDQVGSGSGQGEATSGYTGDWKDQVGSGPGQGEATSGYTGDWKDSVGSEAGQDGSGSSGYTGDWKDQVGSGSGQGGAASGAGRTTGSVTPQ